MLGFFGAALGAGLVGWYAFGRRTAGSLEKAGVGTVGSTVVGEFGFRGSGPYS